MNELESFFDTPSLQRGHELFRTGSVIECEFDSDTNLLLAKVKGTRSRPYEVEIYIDDYGRPDEAYCTCPVEFDCKHAVAALLAHRQTQENFTQRNLTQPGGTPILYSASNGADALAETWWHRWTASLDRASPTIYTAKASSRAHSTRTLSPWALRVCNAT